MPVTDNTEVPSHFGLRHLAAIGATEHSDDIAIVISEETSKITFIHGNEIIHDINSNDLVGSLHYYNEIGEDQFATQCNQATQTFWNHVENV